MTSTNRITGRVTARRTGVLLLAVVLVELLALAVNRSLVRVAGASMEPALTDGDLLLTAPATRRARRPGRVVVVEDPAEPGHLVVKRVHAVGPAGVEVRGDLPERSTDSRTWGPLPPAAVRRLALARWPDVRTTLHRRPPARDQPVGPGPAAAAPAQPPGREATSNSSGSSSATSPSPRRP